MAVHHEDELRREIAAGRVTVILGAGVSMAATGGAPTASWIGLLTDGIDRCVAVVPGLPARWPDRMRDLLDLGREGDPEALLSVAEQITVKLGGPAGGELKRWLRETVGALRVRHPDVPRTLGELGVPLLTTNYDDVLEDATHRRALDWRDTADVERVLRGEDNAIVHLHGYWRRSENLVLGVRSYEDVLHGAHAQTVLRALRMTKTLLFVGFGAGLDDPNFGALLRWTREVFASSEVRHYRLARADEVAKVQAQHKPEERIFVLPYGETHADLAPFLAGLAPDTREAAPVRVPVALEPDAAPRPRILVAGPLFGVPAEMRPEIWQIWTEDSTKLAPTIARIRAKLRSAGVRQAQLAAILRYDVILDLSPWRAFESHWSLGLRDVEREPLPREGAPVPLLYIVHSASKTPRQRALRNDLLAIQLRAARRQFPELASRIDELKPLGVAVAGFDARALPPAIPAFFPRARIVSDVALGRLVARSTRVNLAIERLDAPILNPSLDDYRRALRITAGQVTLAGETTPRPISDVYVELEIQPEEERRAQPSPPQGDGKPGTIEALREEVEARRKAAWDLPGSEVIPASAIHEIARRILLWGPAGTGKSTLLRHLACKVADEGRIPLWIPRLVELGDNLPDTLAVRALQAVGLPDGPSPARTQLREAVESGQAFLFLDGFDEAPTAVRRTLPQRIRDLPPDMRVVIASRPLHRMHTGLVEITLTGLPVNGAEALLRAYFKDAMWIAPLLHALDLLADGTAWARNPVLLGLAASVYRHEKALPDATLDLYKQVIDDLLKPLADTWPIEKVRGELKLLARKMLLPLTGDPTVTVREGDLPYAYREALLASGLFTGDEWLRFTHLTLGEYLAASSFDFDFAAERERERARPEGRAEEESALEVLPMAHALFSNETALIDAFQDAKDPVKETPGHRMLRLVLRAIGYGGKAVRTFCERKFENDDAWGIKVLAALADRLKAHSGRFGDFERQLMADTERALIVLRPLVDIESGAKIVAWFAPLLATPGEVGTEAHIVLWNLGLRQPVKRSSGWWDTIKRQGRALVRAGVGVDKLIELTNGADRLSDQDVAVKVLGDSREYWPNLRPLLNEASDWIREDVVWALRDDPESTAEIRECLNADDGGTRAAAVNALAQDSQSRTANLERLLACIDDRHEFVRSAAVHQLIDESEALPYFRRLLRASRTNWFDPARAEVLEKLASDLEARSTIEACLDTPGISLGAPTLKALSRDPVWLQLVRRRLTHDPPDDDAIRALAEDEVSWPRLRSLLRHARGDIRHAAICALRNDKAAYIEILSVLDNQQEVGGVRAACVAALKNHPDASARLQLLLVDADEEVRCAAIAALEDDLSVIGSIRDRLQDKRMGPRRAAIVALAKHPSLTREVLWSYFSALAERQSEGGLWFSGLRASVVTELSADVGSKERILAALTDEDTNVRYAAVEVLAKGVPDFSQRMALINLVNTDVPMVRDAALKALSDEPTIRERLVPALQNDGWRLRLVGFRLLVSRAVSCKQILGILQAQGAPGSVRVTTIEPLAHVRMVRDSLYAYLDDPDVTIRRTMIRVLRRDTKAKLHLRQALVEGRIKKDLFDFTLNQVAEVLADDPEAHPYLLELSRSADNNVVAAVVPGLANYPTALPRLREIFADKKSASDERVAVVQALAGDDESKPAILALLDTAKKNENVCAAAIEALADSLEARPRIRALLADHQHAKVRRAALKVLAQDLSARDLLRSQLKEESEDDIRTAIIEALSGDPHSVPMLRDGLRDPSSYARSASANALRRSPSTIAFSLADLPSVRLALQLAGSDPTPASALPSLGLRDRLEAFVKSPRPLNLDRDPVFAEAILGWLCARLCWAAEDGAFRNGRVFGEVKERVDALRVVDPLLIRVAMDATELPRERFLRPAHNVIEAWRVATHLSAMKPPALFLACADVDFEHLVPPELAPGEVFWGPGFFGFRLREAKTEALDPMELLVSSDAREAWQGATEETRARYLEMMSRLANLASLDPWALVPVLSRVGDLLPLSVQSAFAQRLPRAMSENVLQLEQASRSLGAHESVLPVPGLALGTRTEAATSAPAKLQAALDIVRATLEGSGSIDPAIDAFEEALGALVSGEVQDADRDDVVMLLDGLRDRMTTGVQAKRVLAIAVKIDDTMLSRGARRRLHDLKSWL